MSAVDQNPWTCAQLDTIRTEWLAGTSVAEIGRMIGRPKNSVAGKIHRLGLPARPSPIIRRAGQQVAPQPARLKKAPQTALVAPGPLSAPEIGSAGTVAAPVRMGRSCEWVAGAKGSYVKCGAPISRGSYCAEHAAVCYLGQGVAENADLMPSRARLAPIYTRSTCSRTAWASSPERVNP